MSKKENKVSDALEFELEDDDAKEEMNWRSNFENKSYYEIVGDYHDNDYNN